MKYALLPVLVVLPYSTARADVKLPSVFADHMVLQRDKPIPIWGQAAPGEKVVVSLGEKSAEITAGADGKWRANLPAAKAGGPYVLKVKGNNEVSLNDVYLGEVWVASGQSNMQFTLDRAKDGAAEMAAANFPLIREFNAKAIVADAPRDDVAGNWVVCSPDTAKQFSAVAYFFARELNQKLKVPIGILHASQGWTPGEAWMSREALSSDANLKRDVLDPWDSIARDYPEAKRDYDEKMKAWQTAADAAKVNGGTTPARPKAPKDPAFIHRATGLWNGSVAPLIPYGMRGVIWYQGETNDNRGYQYRTMFRTLIADWRKQWGQGDFPFFYVQLASVLPPDPKPVESEWAEVREAQSMALTLPATGMAVAIDIGEEKDVHPKNKQDVGHRLALAALAKAYGQKVEFSGPVYKSMKVEGDKVRLTFDCLNEGLAARGDGEIAGFDIAGADKVFTRAHGRIEGKTVLVWGDGVTAPVAVRYAWANNPMDRANLYSKTKAGELLPASPFRTDDWPGKSFGDVRMPIDSM